MAGKRFGSQDGHCRWSMQCSKTFSRESRAKAERPCSVSTSSLDSALTVLCIAIITNSHTTSLWVAEDKRVGSADKAALKIGYGSLVSVVLAAAKANSDSDSFGGTLEENGLSSAQITAVTEKYTVRSLPKPARCVCECLLRLLAFSFVNACDQP